jgi:hypothetical protein
MKYFIPFLILLFLASCRTATQEHTDTIEPNIAPKEVDYLLSIRKENEPEFSGASGYTTPEGDTIVPMGKYIHCFTDTIFDIGIVLKEGTICMAIDKTGKELYQVKWYDNGPDYLSEGLFRIIKDGKTGYANEKGEIIIEPLYECTNPFENGKARVSLKCELKPDGDYTQMISDGWFFINKMGEKIQ